MKSYKQIAEENGSSIELVKDAMRNARAAYAVNSDGSMTREWRVGNDGTGVIGRGRTKGEAVEYALANNAQMVAVLY
mgnify:CR=1 FL=1